MSYQQTEWGQLRFGWRRAKSGYEWRDGPFQEFGVNPTELQQDRVLVAIGEPVEEYQLSANLFLAFSSLHPDEESIRAFADEWGLLGRYTGGIFFPKITPGKVMTGEPFKLWRDEIHAMARAQWLWESIKNEPELKDHIKWKGADAVLYEDEDSLEFEEAGVRTPRPGTTIASRETNPDVFATFKPGDLIRPARHYLQGLVRDHLIAPLRLVWTHDRKHMSLIGLPDSLIDYLWFELARSIADYRSFRPCLVCRQTMLVAAEGKGYRSKRLTCSDACRTKAHDIRVKAAAFRKKQRSHEKIAEQLNIDPEQLTKIMDAGQKSMTGRKRGSIRK